MSASLVRLYGNKAIVFHDGKTTYQTQSGYVDLPQHLVVRAIDMGFSRRPFADLASPETVPLDPEAPRTEDDLEIAPGAPATQVSALPPEHPQSIETKTIATKEQLRAAEERLRGGGSTS